MINLPKFSRIGPLEKVSMPKTHRGSTIRDKFIVVEIIVVIFMDFPDLDKAHWASVIDDFFTSFVNVCLSRILLMPKWIYYLSNLYVNNLCKPKPPSVDVDEDQHSMTIFFCVVPLLT
jgi:hypothetical protein